LVRNKSNHVQYCRELVHLLDILKLRNRNFYPKFNLFFLIHIQFIFLRKGYIFGLHWDLEIYQHLYYIALLSFLGNLAQPNWKSPAKNQFIDPIFLLLIGFVYHQNYPFLFCLCQIHLGVIHFSLILSPVLLPKYLYCLGGSIWIYWVLRVCLLE
jgi:hypothetical protein